MWPSPSEDVRPAPRIIRVEPLRAAPTVRDLWVIAAGTVALATACVAFFPNWVGWTNAGILLVIGQVVGVVEWLKYRAARLHAAQREMEDAPAARAPVVVAADDPVAAALRAAYRSPSRTPPLRVIRQAVASAVDSPGGVLVCLNTPDPPAAGDYRFEPELVTPTRSLGSALGWMMLGGAPLIVWLTQFLPGARWRISLWGFVCVFASAIIWGALWIWHGVVRPRYVRIAPRMIHVMRYSPFGGAPRIRRYPMRAGTIAVLAVVSGQTRLSLARDDVHDVIWLSEMSDSARLIERVWQALLSTAPTPPMSSEELIG